MLLVPLTVRQIHSMQRMQQYLPEMKAIQKRYKNDRKKQNEELMKFYKEHQINPASSCLPIIPQIPIFFALYFVLRDFDDEIYPLYPESDLELARLRPGHHGEHHLGLVRLRAARGLRGQPGGVDVVHADAEQGPARDLPDPPVRLRVLHPRPARRHRVPGRSAHLLDDDEPLDGRPGDRDARPATEDHARARQALVADPSEDRADGWRRPSGGDGAEPAPKPAGQPRKVKRKKKRGARR